MAGIGLGSDSLRKGVLLDIQCFFKHFERLDVSLEYIVGRLQYRSHNSQSFFKRFEFV